MFKRIYYKLFVNVIKVFVTFDQFNAFLLIKSTNLLFIYLISVVVYNFIYIYILIFFVFFTVKDKHLKYFRDKDCINKISGRTNSKVYKWERDVVTNRCYLSSSGPPQMRKSIEIMHHSSSPLSRHGQWKVRCTFIHCLKTFQQYKTVT